MCVVVLVVGVSFVFGCVLVRCIRIVVVLYIIMLLLFIIMGIRLFGFSFRYLGDLCVFVLCLMRLSWKGVCSFFSMMCGVKLVLLG